MSPSSPVREITSMAELTALLASTTYVAVDFYAEWCGPCKQISPQFGALAREHAELGRHLVFAQVNVDRARDVAAHHAIRAMPTFLFFKAGRKVAVHGHPEIQGADLPRLRAAVAKLAGLARQRCVEDDAAAAAAGK